MQLKKKVGPRYKYWGRRALSLLPYGLKKQVKRIAHLLWKGGNTRPLSTQPLLAKSQDELVCIVLPVYNHRLFVAEAIRSVLAQSYQHLELIIVDDGSDEILLDYILPFIQDPRVTYVRQSHRGLPTALNTGFSMASGSLLTWTSADNRLGRTNIEEMVHIMQTDPSIGLLYCDYSIIDVKGKRLRKSGFRVHNQDRLDKSIIRLPENSGPLDQIQDNFIGPCFMYRRESAWVGHYNDSLGVEDYDYWIRIKQHFKLSHFGSPYDFYEYRVHEDTLSAKEKELKIQDKGKRILERSEKRKMFLQKQLGIINLSGHEILKNMFPSNLASSDVRYKVYLRDFIISTSISAPSSRHEAVIYISDTERLQPEIEVIANRTYIMLINRRFDNKLPDMIKAIATSIFFDNFSSRGNIELTWSITKN